MDIKLKQRILGIAVLFSLLVFCLFLLLQGNKKNQPHIPSINVEPPISQLAAPTTTEKPATANTVSAPNTIPPLESSKNEKPSSKVIPVPVTHAPTVTPIEKPSNTVKPVVSQPSPAVSEPKTIDQNSNQTITISDDTETLAKVLQEPSKKLTKKPSIVKTAEHPHAKHNVTRNEPGNFVVQVGAFKEASNAKKLSTQLTKEGYVVDTRKIRTSSGELTLVAVGGSGIKHTEAQKIQTTLESQYKVSPIIKPTKSQGN